MTVTIMIITTPKIAMTTTIRIATTIRMMTTNIMMITTTIRMMMTTSIKIRVTTNIYDFCNNVDNRCGGDNDDHDNEIDYHGDW